MTWGQSIANFSSYLSPRAILANYLSATLTEYFDVDPAAVETSLLQDAHVSLRDVRLKPSVADNALSLQVNGSIELIDFSWKWGSGSGDGVEAFIKDVQVTVRGVRLEVFQMDKANVTETVKPTVTETVKIPAEQHADTDWRARYFQQILDNLTVEFDDLSLVVHIANDEWKLHLVGSGVQLVTLRDDATDHPAPPLSQRMAIGSLSAFFQSQSGDVRLPVLDDFGYQAHLKRVSGRRFVDGIANGLIVTGENIVQEIVASDADAHVTNSVRFHVGSEQMKHLRGLCELLITPPSDSDEAVSEEHSVTPTGDGSTRSSLLVLPIQCMVLVLDDRETDITLHASVFRYKTDGSEFSMDCGSGGLSIGGKYVSEKQVGNVHVDFLEQHVRIEPLGKTDLSTEFFDTTQDETPKDALVMDLTLNMELLEVVFEHFLRTCQLRDDINQGLDNGVVSKINLDTKAPIQWSVVVDGFLRCRIMGSGPKWLEIRAGSLMVDPSVSWESLEISTSDGSKVRVLKGKYDGVTNSLTVDESVQADVSSYSSGKEVVLHVWDSIANTSIARCLSPDATKKSKEATTLPCSFSLPEIVVSLQRPRQAVVGFSEISGEGSVVQIKGMVSSLDSKDKDRLEAKDLSFSFGGDALYSFVCQVSTMQLSHLGYLAQPTNCVLKYHERKLNVLLSSTLIEMWSESDDDTKPSAMGNDLVSQFLMLPFDISLTAERVEVRNRHTSGQFVGNHIVANFNTENKRLVEWSKETQKCLICDVFCESMCCNQSNTATGTFEHSRTRCEMIGYESAQNSEFPLSAASIGCLVDGSVSIGGIPTLRIDGTGQLIQPIQGLDVKVQGRNAILTVGAVHWQQFDASTAERSVVPNVPTVRVEVNCTELVLSRERNTGGAIGTTLRCQSMYAIVLPVDHASVFDVRLAQCNNVEYLDIFSSSAVTASVKCDFGNLERFEDLTVNMTAATMTADFASSSWSDQVSADAKARRREIPFASISPFELTFNFKGLLRVAVIDDAKMAVDSFVGNEQTTIETLSKHYQDMVSQRALFLLSKTQLVGANVGDQVSTIAATAALNSTLLGGVTGVMGRDAVGAVLTKGKSSRGVSSSAGYKFGDFSRGVVTSVKDAAAHGASLRGDDTYKVGDVSTSASKAAAEYASQNRVRLSAAGGSSLGMIAGLAAAGPVGLVAGALMGASVAGKAMKNTMGDPKSAEQDLSASERSATASLISDPSNTRLEVPLAEAQPFPQITSVSMIQPVGQEPVDVLAQPLQPLQQVGVLTGSSTPSAENGDLGSRTRGDFFFAEEAEDLASWPVAPETSSRASIANYQELNPGASIQQTTRTTVASSAPSLLNDSSTPRAQPQPNTANQAGGYRFGDLTRSVVARGRQSRGASDNEGYRFGDFTRGLFR